MGRRLEKRIRHTRKRERKKEREKNQKKKKKTWASCLFTVRVWKLPAARDDLAASDNCSRQGNAGDQLVGAAPAIQANGNNARRGNEKKGPCEGQERRTTTTTL